MNDPLYTLDDFLAGVVVDHIDGVTAEDLIERHFSGAWELAA